MHIARLLQVVLLTVAMVCSAPMVSVRAQATVAGGMQDSDETVQWLPPVESEPHLAMRQQAELVPLPKPPSGNLPSPELVPRPMQPYPVNQLEPVTLEHLEQMALAHNPTLVQAAARIESLNGKRTQDGLYPNPRIMYRADEMGDEGRTGFQGATLGQEIVTSRKLHWAQAVDAEQIRQAGQEYTAQQLRVCNDVKLRFNEVLLAQRALEIYGEMERISLVAANVADDLFKANQAGRSDVLQAQVEADVVRLQSVKARNAYQSAWRRLATVVGLPELQPSPLSGEVQSPSTAMTWDEVWNRLLATSPEFLAVQAKASAARSAVSKAMADRYPNIDWEVGFSHDNITGDGTSNTAVTVPVPLFNRNQGNIRQAQSDLTVAEADVERMALELRNRLALVFERYSNAREMVDRYENSILPKAKESIDLTARRYRAGESNYTALLVTQRMYLQTQATYLDSLRELRETTVLLDGMLLSDSLPGSR